MLRPNDEIFLAQQDLTRETLVSLSRSAMIAWDIETTGLDWQTDTIGTIQIYEPTIGTIIVNHITEPPARLLEILEHPAIVKVFHHAPFDLRFILHEWKSLKPRNIRCTKVASKMVNPDATNSTHSLGALLEARLGIHLDKGSVRTSNWSGSLNSEQMKYAANDVRYLSPLLDRLTQELGALGRLKAYDECCRFLPTLAELQVQGFPDVFAY